MSLQVLHPDILVDVILPYLPARFILDYQMAPIWFKLLPKDYHDLFTQRSLDYLFSKKYEKKKSSVIDLLLKILKVYRTENYGSMESIVPQEFTSFVGELKKVSSHNFESIRETISFKEIQFVFEFVSRYNFIYLSNSFNNIVDKCTEPFEFSWVYAVDPYYQTNQLLLFRRLRKSDDSSKYICTELESMEGCKRIRGQFYFKNGQYCCELYKGLFVNIEKKEMINVDPIWSQTIEDSMFCDKEMISDEYFIQRYLLPSLESKLCFSSASYLYKTNTFPVNQNIYSSFKLTIIPSENKLSVEAIMDRNIRMTLLFVFLWLLLIYYKAFWPLSDHYVFQTYFPTNPYYWKSILYIISDILVLNNSVVYIFRSFFMLYLGMWKIHHITLFESIGFMYLFRELYYYLSTHYRQYFTKKQHTEPIPWISKSSKKMNKNTPPIHTSIH